MTVKPAGMTLVELITAVAVALILMTVGIPLYQGLVANGALVAQTNQLVAALQLARSEAVKRVSTVSVCAVADASAADPVCASSAAWQQGWLVFLDANANGGRDSGETVLRVWSAHSRPSVMSVNPSGVVSVSFGARGAAELASGDSLPMTLSLTQPGATSQNKRCVETGASGQIRSFQVDYSASCN